MKKFKKKANFSKFLATCPITMTMLTRRQQKNVHKNQMQGAQTRRQTAGKQRYAIADQKQSSVTLPSRVSTTTVGSAHTVITSRKGCFATNDSPSHSRSESSSGSPDSSATTCKKVFPKGTIDLATINSNLHSKIRSKQA